MASPGNRNIFYKYESVKTKWSRQFEGKNEKATAIIKNFFKFFYRDHRDLTFVEGKLFDKTTHLFLSPEQYKQIKDEIEETLNGETLLEVSQLRDVTILDERKRFPNFQSFVKFSSKIHAENRKIEERRKADARKRVGELQTTIRTNPKAVMLAFDVEAYEHDHSIILEIGCARTTLDNQEEVKTFHYIIKENLRYKNNDCVPDNRGNFKFGTSQHMSREEAAAKLRKHLEDADFLVTHSGAHDTEFLKSCGVSVSRKLMFDTQVLALALIPKGHKMYSLKNLLDDLEIPFDKDVLHNGGNDAFYTLKVFLSLAKLARDAS